MAKETKIYYLSTIILVGFFLAIVFHYMMGSYLGYGYPYNTFLCGPWDRFSDFYRTIDMQDRNPYFRAEPSGAFPFMNIVGFFLSLLGTSSALVIYIIFLTASLLYYCKIYLAVSDLYLTSIASVIFTLFTFPFVFTLDRGNIEGAISIILLMFITAFLGKKYLLAALVLSLASAMKVFPAALLILFIPEKRYKEMVISVIATGVLTLASLLFFKGGFWNNFLHFLLLPNVSSYYLTSYFGANNIVFHGINIYNLLKITMVYGGQIKDIDMGKLLSAYNLTVSALFVIVSLYVTFIEKNIWKRVALLIIAMIIFPLLAGDYRVMYMYVPLFLFINSPEKSAADWLYVVLLGLLFIPKNYFYIPGIISDYGTDDIPIGTLLNIIILITLLGSIMATGIKEKLSQIHIHRMSQNAHL